MSPRPEEMASAVRFALERFHAEQREGGNGDDLGGEDREPDAVGALDEVGRGLQAIEELLQKPLRQIQEDTAYTWAWRAWAAYTLAKRATTVHEIIKWKLVATECEHEAFEHAALVDGCKVLQSVKKVVAKAKKA